MREGVIERLYFDESCAERWHVGVMKTLIGEGVREVSVQVGVMKALGWAWAWSVDWEKSDPRIIGRGEGRSRLRGTFLIRVINIYN